MATVAKMIVNRKGDWAGVLTAKKVMIVATFNTTVMLT
jgi:hypothetical protein